MTDITDEHMKAALEYLETNAVGWDNRVTSDEIDEVLQFNDSHDTNPSVRKVIQQLRSDPWNVPVHGNGSGYCILGPDELDDAEEHIRGQIGSLNELLIDLRQSHEAYEYGSDTTPEPPGECDKCDGAIDGDPYYWYSRELCYDCYQNKPATESDFKEWVEG